jgi:hypothetical protein
VGSAAAIDSNPSDAGFGRFVAPACAMLRRMRGRATVRALGFCIPVLAACQGPPSGDAPAPSPSSAAATALEPWQPVDPAFTGCEGG